MHDKVMKALSYPVVKQRVEDQGLYGAGSTPRKFAKVIEDEFAPNKKLATSMRIAPQ